MASTDMRIVKDYTSRYTFKESIDHQTFQSLCSETVRSEYTDRVLSTGGEGRGEVPPLFPKRLTISLHHR